MHCVQPISYICVVAYSSCCPKKWPSSMKACCGSTRVLRHGASQARFLKFKSPSACCASQSQQKSTLLKCSNLSTLLAYSMSAVTTYRKPKYFPSQISSSDSLLSLFGGILPMSNELKLLTTRRKTTSQVSTPWTSSWQQTRETKTVMRKT